MEDIIILTKALYYLVITNSGKIESLYYMN
nr:MAG TPA: hypothetical protein [Caudoviricetes sp.]